MLARAESRKSRASGVKTAPAENNLHGVVKVLVGNGFVSQSLELIRGSHLAILSTRTKILNECFEGA
jgi:hypothetical protein